MVDVDLTRHQQQLIPLLLRCHSFTDSRMTEEESTRAGGDGYDEGRCRDCSGTSEDDEGEEGDADTSGSTRFSGGTGETGGVDDEEWLQLGIGRMGKIKRRRSTSPAIRGKDSVIDGSEDLLDLSLFSKRHQQSGTRERPLYPFSPTDVSSTARFVTSPDGYQRYPRLAGAWNVETTSILLSTSTPTVATPSVSNYHHPQQLPYDVIGSRNLSSPATEIGRNPVEEIRVVTPPPRPTDGLWFVLQASQEKEPFVPQISKSYLRIKNRGTTILLLMKYLAIKLGLVNESEVEITCKGQILPPHLTLLHVRDNIWYSTEIIPNLQDSTLNHVMTLEYRRST